MSKQSTNLSELAEFFPTNAKPAAMRYEIVDLGGERFAYNLGNGECSSGFRSYAQADLAAQARIAQVSP